MKTLQIGKNNYQVFEIDCNSFMFHTYSATNVPPCPDLIGTTRTFPSVIVEGEAVTTGYIEFTYPALIIDGKRYGAKLIGENKNIINQEPELVGTYGNLIR